MSGLKMKEAQVDSLEKATTLLNPELRGDAAVIMYGMIAQEAPAKGGVIDHNNAVGGYNNAYSGIFQQNDQSFNWGFSQYSPEMQNSMRNAGINTQTDPGGAGLAALAHTYDAFKNAQDKEGFQPQLFHANWAQFGRGNMAEIARIKKLHPEHRLVDLEKGTNGAPKYQPKYNPAFFEHMKRQSKQSMRMDQTIPQNEEMMWNNYWKKNGIGNEARRSYTMRLWEAHMKKGK